MTERLDKLFEEVDRQLEEIREQALALATRAGMLVSVAAIGAAVLAARLNNLPGDFGWVFWPLGFALFAGIGALAPGLTVGPKPEMLTHWTSGTATTALTNLYVAKVGTLGTNRTRLLVMIWAFYIEAAAVGVAIVLALVVAARR